MDCPKCGYMMTDLEVECPRCKRIGAPVKRPAPPSPPPAAPAYPPVTSAPVPARGRPVDPALAIRCYRCGNVFNRSLWQWSSKCPKCKAHRWASVEGIVTVNFAYWASLALLVAVFGGFGVLLAVAGLYFVNRTVFSLFGTGRLYRP